MNDNKKLKRAELIIVILSLILIALLILLLCLHSCGLRRRAEQELSVSSGNFIRSGTEQPESTGEPEIQDESTPVPQNTDAAQSPSPTPVPETKGSAAGSNSSGGSRQKQITQTLVPTQTQEWVLEEGVSLSLFALHAGDSVPFYVTNMFPGDAVTKQYHVRAYCNNDINVNFQVTVRKGYEKLAEVLMLRVTDPTTGEVLYDGKIDGMTEVISRHLNTSGRHTQSLSYEITAYLDTSVGNAYMSLPLVADFRWWTQDTGNLVLVTREGFVLIDLLTPLTGDNTMLLLWVVVLLAAAAVTTVLIVKLRRERSDKKEKK